MKTTIIEEPEAPNSEVSDAELAKEWQSLDWPSIEKQVSRMQTRISKATISNKRNDIEPLRVKEVDDGLSRVR